MDGDGFKTPKIIEGEPWRYVLVPERLVQEVYALVAGVPESSPVQDEITQLEAQRNTATGVERRRLTWKLSAKRRQLRASATR